MTEQEARQLKPGEIITYMDKHIDYHLILEVSDKVKSICLWDSERPTCAGNIYYTNFDVLDYYRIEDDPEVKARYL
jgi:hypothetical protein